MRKIVFILMIITSKILCQNTLFDTCVFNVGDNYFVYQCDTTGVTPGPSGTNISYLFSTLTMSTSGTYFAKNASNGLGSSFFPNATTCLTFNNAFSDYYILNNQRLDYIGSFYQPSTVVSLSNYRTDLVLPLTYNDSFVDTSIQGNIKRLSIKNVDGWGTLTLPNGTFNNILRLRTNYLDSNTFNNTVKDSGLIYQYYDCVNHYPLLYIEYSYTNGVLNKVVQYLQSMSNSIADFSDEVELKMYPNPSNGLLYFNTGKSRNKIYLANIYNLTGDLISKNLIEVIDGIGSLNIDVENGVYLLSLNLDEKTRLTYKIVIIK